MSINISILVAVTIVIGALALVNLLLTYGLVRRVKALDHALGDVGAVLPALGHRVEPFEVSTTEGATVTQADLAEGEHVVALLSAGCGSCDEVVAALADMRSESRPLLLVHAGDGDGELVASARRAGPVALVPHGPLAGAFGVRSFPAVLRIVDGRVAAAGHSPREAGIAAG